MARRAAAALGLLSAASAALVRQEPPKAAEVYATMVDASDRFLPGLQALAQSLKRTGTTRPLVVLVDGIPSADLKATAACMQFSLVQVPPITNPRPISSRSERAYSKLNVFALPAQRVVFLDSDMVVLRSIDELFRMAPSFMAVPDSAGGCAELVIPWLKKKCRQFSETVCPGCFNSGLMVFSPSNATFQDMMGKRTSITSANGGDQGFLNAYLRGVPAPVHALDRRFNTFSLQEETDTGFDLGSVSVVHYSGAAKPWHAVQKHNCPKTRAAFLEFWAAYNRTCLG